jgi:hypothetical protein
MRSARLRRYGRSVEDGSVELGLLPYSDIQLAAGPKWLPALLSHAILCGAAAHTQVSAQRASSAQKREAQRTQWTWTWPLSSEAPLALPSRAWIWARRCLRHAHWLPPPGRPLRRRHRHPGPSSRSGGWATTTTGCHAHLEHHRPQPPRARAATSAGASDPSCPTWRLSRTADRVRGSACSRSHARLHRTGRRGCGPCEHGSRLVVPRTSRTRRARPRRPRRWWCWCRSSACGGRAGVGACTWRLGRAAWGNWRGRMGRGGHGGGL